MRTDPDPILLDPIDALTTDTGRPGRLRTDTSLVAPAHDRRRPQQALERAELQFVTRVVNDGGIGPWRALTDQRFSLAHATFLRHGRLSRASAASLVVALADQPTRDRCWLAVESAPEPHWPAFWLYLSRRALPPFRVEPLFLLAWSAWRRGDLRLAVAAADAVVAEDRDHGGGVVLRAMLRGGLAPAQVPSLADWPATWTGAG